MHQNVLKTHSIENVFNTFSYFNIKAQTVFFITIVSKKHFIFKIIILFSVT